MDMGRKKINRLLRFLLSAGLVLTEPETREKIRDGLSDRVDDLTDRASRKYDDVAERFGRAARVVRGEDDHTLSNVLGFVAGVGLGVGLGILFAPASGEDTRAAIVDKVQTFEGGVRERVRRATGTEGRSD